MLALTVPPLDRGTQPAIGTRPREAAAWLERLPFASPPDAAQQLTAALHALNRHPLDAEARLALLTLCQPVVTRVAASIETQLAEAGVPPHAQLRQTGLLLRELLLEFSLGYKQALVAGDSLKPARHAALLAGALAALGAVQFACHLSYSALPVSLWREIQLLTRHARETGVADVQAADGLTPSLAYRQALLIALADPPQMSRAELLHTRAYLGSFATLATLTTGPVRGHRGFPLYADADTPPTPLVERRTETGLWLDTHELCRHLHTTAIRLRTGDTPRRIGLPPQMEAGLSQTLCKRLLKLWSGGLKRGFRRHAAPGSTVQVVAGVSAIHRLLEVTPQVAETELDDEPLPIRDADALAAAPASVSASCWTVSNDSATGLALLGQPDAPLNLKVGDPLALHACDGEAGEPAAAALDGQSEGWSLAVIRWIRMRDTQQVELGLERLSPRVRPVWVRTLRGHRKAVPQPALLIPRVPALEQADRLLLPRHLYEAGMDAELWHSPYQYTLTFGRRLEHTSSFDLIDFTIFAREQA